MRVKKLVPLGLAASLAMLTACQVGGLPTNSGAAKDVTVGANTQGKVNVLKPGEVQTNPNLANPSIAPNASVMGVLLDTNGQPVAGALVSTLGGQTAVTDAEGKYTIQVAAEAGKEVVLIFQKDGFVYSSDRVTMNPGETAALTSDVKQMDAKVNLVTTAGGTFVNSTGVLEIDVPEGALTADTKMILTPLSYGANGQPNELPGPLETVDENGNRNLLMPVEYWAIDMEGGELKAGESISMRMLVPENPDAPVKLKAGDLIPCYIYDAEQGYWNSPNLGPIVEKDGKLWATYEIKASSLTDRVNPAVRTVQQASDPDPLPNGHPMKGKVERINCGGVDEDGNRTTRNLPRNGSTCNDDELRHNAWVERQQGGAASNFLGVRSRGISGGHT
ncbi:MAG: carboxypeptidase-like regulatory domain-containing protein, partial [Candidatus Sericytochromatia bacterium]